MLKIPVNSLVLAAADVATASLPWQAGLRYGLLGLPLAFAALALYVVLPHYYADQLGLSVAWGPAAMLAVLALTLALGWWALCYAPRPSKALRPSGLGQTGESALWAPLRVAACAALA